MSHLAPPDLPALPRRRHTRALLVLLALMLALPGALAASPKDILVVVQVLDDLVSLDPGESFELSGLQIFNNVYQRLVAADPDHPQAILPVLAQRWTAGADGRSLTFELRSAARFASGNPLRPEDVVFSLRRAVVLNRAPAFILNQLGWTADNVSACLTVPDPSHVRISWPARVGPDFALHVLGAPVASILDQQLIAPQERGNDAGNAWLRAHSAGSGPFVLRRYVPHEAVVLEANPVAVGGGPQIRTVVIRNVADAASRRLLVAVGDADIARDLGPDQIAALQGHPGLKTVEFPSATLHYLMLNSTRTDRPELGNPALWEAVRWLIDYDGIAIGLLKGAFSVHQSFLAEGFPGALNTRPYHLDVARARRVLRAAGLDHDLTLELDVFNQPPYLEIAQSLQATFAAAGIRLEIHPLVGSELFSRVRTRREDAVWLNWVPDYFDPHSTASAFALNRDDGTRTVAWRAGWRIPELSARTLAAAGETDPLRRAQAYAVLQTEVQQHSPLIVALQEHARLVMRAGVEGYRQGLNADMVYYDRVRK